MSRPAAGPLLKKVETDVPIRGPTIDLDQFLKLAGVASTGGQAKQLIHDGLVQVNGQPETRRRRTLQPGDTIRCGAEAFRVASSA